MPRIAGEPILLHPVFDPQDDAPRPWEAARVRVGRVAFANADAAWEPFAHVAIEEGHRASSELLW